MRDRTEGDRTVGDTTVGDTTVHGGPADDGTQGEGRQDEGRQDDGPQDAGASAEGTPATAAFARQARACDAMGSPFTATLCRVLPTVLDRGTEFGRRLLDWPAGAEADAMALRACGALHHLVRSGTEPDLAAAYPPHPTDPDLLAARLVPAVARHDARLAAFLDGPPQTNEPARSSAVLGALLLVAAQDPRPVELLEIGASAGLNLLLDRYRHVLGDTGAWGPPDSPVVLRPDWRGRPPSTDHPVTVVGRAGCDLNPIDPADPVAVDRLLSYVWADQAARLRRTTAALRLAVEAGLRVERADAAAWLPARLEEPQHPGTVRVVVHTVVRQYLPDATRRTVEDAVAAAGARATRDAPLAHVALEPDGHAPGGAVTLTTWPGGEVRLVARADMHARWVDWA